MKGLFQSKKVVFLSIAALLVVVLAIWCVVDAGTGIRRVNTFYERHTPEQAELVKQVTTEYSNAMAELDLPENSDIATACPDHYDFIRMTENVILDHWKDGSLANQTAYAQMAVQGRILGWYSGEQGSTQFIVLVTRDIVGKRGALRTLRVAVPQGSNCAEILKETGEVVLFLDVIDKDKALTRLHVFEHSIFEVNFLGRVHSYSNKASNQYYNGRSVNQLVKTIKELARAMEIE